MVCKFQWLHSPYFFTLSCLNICLYSCHAHMHLTDDTICRTRLWLCMCMHVYPHVFAYTYTLLYIQHIHKTMSQISLVQCLFLLFRNSNLLCLNNKYLYEEIIKNLNFIFEHAYYTLPTTNVTKNTNSDPTLSFGALSNRVSRK